MKKRRVKVKYPHIRLEVGDEIFELEGWEGEVKNLHDLRHSFAVPPWELFRSLLAHVTSGDLKAQVTFEGEGGGQLEIPFKMSGFEWLNVITLSEQSVRAMLGNEIPVRYMGRLHKALYLTSIKSRSRVGMTRSLTTLETLGLIQYHKVTLGGEQVLEQLDALGPPQNTAGLVMKANELIDVHGDKSARNPLRVWLERNLLIMPNHTPGMGKFRLTDSGHKWLTAHGEQLLNIKKFVRRRQLIMFLPMEALNEFLTSEDPDKRGYAQQRAEELGYAITDP